MVDTAVEFASEITPTHMPSGTATQRGSGSPLIGRTAELGQLDTVLDRLGRGGPAVVDLTGAAGIGKSRLLGSSAAAPGNAG